MTMNPQDALNRLMAAFEAHAQAARAAEFSDPSIVEAADQRLRDAFFTYDDALFNAYEVELPLEIVDEDDDDYDDFDDDDLDDLDDDDLDDDLDEDDLDEDDDLDDDLDDLDDEYDFDDDYDDDGEED
ncbi:hypothetical protein QS713_05820 [Gleimia hominis]|uniref:DNA primase n=1 Tax=Gleimia hominis TaxID=595468 RepID=A0ABU3IB27_9ACTO|nr:hypothetical protein [Gleimia hominis]MDT3767579.1 hypothetical protein [Gleimia hominis]